MREGGIGLIVLGALITVISCFLPIAVYTPGAGDVVNFAKMQAQTLAFHGGCTLFIAGIVLFAASAIATARGISQFVEQGDAPLEAIRRPIAPALSPDEAAAVTNAKKDETALIVLGSVAAVVVLVICFVFLA